MFKKAKKIIRFIIIGIYLLIVLFPIYWMITLSLRPLKDILAIPPHWIPYSISISNYADVIFGTGGLKGVGGAQNTLPYMLNSVLISGGATLICVVLGTIAAYGLTKGKSKIMNPVAFGMLAIRMIPPIVLIVPLFILMKQFGLLDTRFGLILVYSAFNIPFSIWMMRGFFMDIPAEIEEAAKIDGCSAFGAFFRVIVPLVSPGLAAASVFIFLQAWNEFLFAAILTRTPAAQTLPVAASFFVREGVSSQVGTNVGAIAVVGTFAIIPMIIFVSLVQKWLVRGLTFGSVKG